MTFSRRTFLFSAGAALAFSAVKDAACFDGEKTYNILVIGDSLIHGEGLSEDNKIYTFLKKWLQENKKFQNVNLIVKAHSGSRLKLHADEQKRVDKISKVDLSKMHREISISFPTINDQLNSAIEDGAKADLVLISAGITDVTVADILNPFAKYSSLKKEIDLYCYDWTLELIKNINRAYPKALVAVVGYYPIITPRSSTTKVWNSVLKVMKFPDILKPVANNVLTRQVLQILKKRMEKRSRIWFERSTERLRSAVTEINKHKGRTIAVFVPSPITEKESYATDETMLWQIGKNNKPNDEVFVLRAAECKKAIAELKQNDINFKQRYCEIAAIGHPNQTSAKAYAESIGKAIEPYLDQ